MGLLVTARIKIFPSDFLESEYVLDTGNVLSWVILPSESRINIRFDLRRAILLVSIYTACMVQPVNCLFHISFPYESIFTNKLLKV